MNHHNTYTLYLDKKHSPYYYYLAYSPDGIRLSGKSTGQKSKTAARLYCDDLLRRGLLYTGINQTFEQYAAKWFDEGSVWVEDRMACGTPDRPALSQGYLTKLRSDLRNYLMPFFRDTEMSRLTPSLVKRFRTWMLQEKDLSHKTVNCAVSTFRIITDTALSDNVIMLDPLRGIKPLNCEINSRDAFSMEEAEKIFSAYWKDEETRLINLVAACTGMRISEIYSIRKENLHADYIDLTDQRIKGKLAPLKTKEARKVPIIPELYSLLAPLCTFGFAFTVIEQQHPYIHLRYVLRDLGLEDERKKRGLCFHSWRHFYNTYLLAENVPPIKVAGVLGHSTGSGSMQERYTNWRADMFPEVYAAQKKLFDDLTKTEAVSLLA